MEKKKKGLFGRLLDFWKEKIGMGETDSIGFWHEKETVEKHFVEMGAVASLTREETKRAFWEEVGFPEKEEKNISILESQKKILSVEPEEGKEELLKNSEEPEKVEEKKKARLFSAENTREKKQEETEEGGFGRTFLWEMPMEEKEKRSIIPVTAELLQEKEVVLEERQEMLPKEATKKEETQVEPVLDIEKLMQEITKKLWEEREGCGRRLR